MQPIGKQENELLKTAKTILALSGSCPNIEFMTQLNNNIGLFIRQADSLSREEMILSKHEEQLVDNLLRKSKEKLVEVLRQNAEFKGEQQKVIEKMRELRKIREDIMSFNSVSRTEGMRSYLEKTRPLLKSAEQPAKEIIALLERQIAVNDAIRHLSDEMRKLIDHLRKTQ
jgi:hypothetical protein